MAEFLLEIGCEEIPASWLADLEKQLAAGALKALQGAGLEPADLVSAATPRRLVVGAQVAARQQDRETATFGPSLKQAKDAAGSWTPAALGFARKNGVAPEALATGPKDPAKPGELNLLFVQKVPGQDAAAVLPGLLAPLLRGMAFPKRMNWDAWLDDGKGAFAFGRPIRWVVALLDGAVLPFTIFATVDGARGDASVKSGNATRGHRSLGPAAGAAVPVSGFGDLEAKLALNKVVLRRAARSRLIQEQLAAAVGTGTVTGFTGMARDEWPDLVEHPAVVSGMVPAEFAPLPVAVRDTVLAHHQKYVPFTDGAGALRFAAVTNNEKQNAGEIVRGMERVVTARLRDAAFFFAEDGKRKLADAAQRLSGVTFFHGLGSYADKAERMRGLIAAMAQLGMLTAAEEPLAQRAALLAKADLTTLMVGEFPELQGTMGALYLAAEGADPAVMHAVRWHYDGVPGEAEPGQARVTAAVALADKLDTLAAHFAAGNIPSGSRDPYGLRRAGLEAVRAALFSWPDGGRRLDLRALLTKALAGAAAFAKRPAAEIAADLEAFLLERLRFVLASRGAENGQWSADEVEAVLGAREPDALGDPQVSLPRLLALHAVRSRNADDFTALAAAFKRVNNILKQAGYARPWNYEKAFTEPAEKALARRAHGGSQQHQEQRRSGRQPRDPGQPAAARRQVLR